MSRTTRKPYTKSKRFDRTCRANGGCHWCSSDRTYADAKRLAAADEELVLWKTIWKAGQKDLENYQNGISRANQNS